MDLKDKYVCVFGASSPHVHESFREAAYALGTLLGDNQIGCVCGAGRAGLMQAVTDGALATSGKVIGIIPQFMVDNKWCHPNLTETIITANMHERKELMMSKSEALVALPGGVGTFEELLEAITWKQLGIINKPIVILNTNGYYDALLDMFKCAANNAFMSSENLNLWYVATSPQNVIEYLKECNVDNTPIKPKY